MIIIPAKLTNKNNRFVMSRWFTKSKKILFCGV